MGEDDAIPGMDAFVLPCWSCGTMLTLDVVSPEGLVWFHKNAATCEDCLAKFGRVNEQPKVG